MTIVFTADETSDNPRKSLVRRAVGWQRSHQERRQLCGQRNSVRADLLTQMRHGCEENKGLPEKAAPAKELKIKGTLEIFHCIVIAKDTVLEADAWQFVKA